MKHIFHHPPEKATGRKYWRSIGQLAETKEFQGWLEREFPEGASELKADGVSRRSFLKLMGASAALAGMGLAACRHPLNLVPFTESSEWSIPGKALFFATSMPWRSGAEPLVITTHDGRPTKVEGNPRHPVSSGGTGTFAQSSLLDLYDPERSRFFYQDGEEATAEDFEHSLDYMIGRLGDGSGLAFLAEENASPTRERLRKEVLKRFPKSRWAVYEPLGNELADAAHAAAYGAAVTSVFNIEAADVVLSLDNDFLGSDEVAPVVARGFANRRRVEKPGDKMNRLYVVENRYTITGGMADHRLRLPASQVGHFVLALAKELGVDAGGITAEGNVELPEGWVREAAADLRSTNGRCLVLVGNRYPVAVQQLVAAINEKLGAQGKTLFSLPQTVEPALSLSDLATAIKEKSVRTLVILGGNPVYNAPSDYNWRELQESIPLVIRLGLHEDETSRVANWHIPAAHYLETWSDGIAYDGSYTAVQPIILPLYNGWSENDLLAKFAGQPKPKGSELVQETFRARLGGADFAKSWNQFLHDGFLPATVKPGALSYRGSLPSAKLAAPAGPGAIEIVFPADAKMDDGRFNNNGWLQEAPDPITKTTWDNVAWISPKTAKELGLKHPIHASEHDLVEIAFDDNRKVEAAIFIVPGHADNSIALSLGWGREVVGKVGEGTGVNAYRLRTSDSLYYGVGAKITNLRRKFPIAHTQEHFSMEGRGLVREATLDEFAENPTFVKDNVSPPAPPNGVSLYPHPKLTSPNQWGMAIDLNTCFGCNACVIACQAENNVPIVGKEQVINGRSMHWLRNDRYFVSDGGEEEDLGEYASDPQMVVQPMMCQHCENAPCETVCPVNATVHSDDGLNVMAYNRCIGTRYCANNCPFKVRRFNFFDYNQRPIGKVKVPILGEVSGLALGPLTKKGMADTLKMQKNPNVTVRMRGVMEKCTFCVQRIQEARIAQKVKAGSSSDTTIPRDSFTSACAQACPTDALVFGDIADPESRVSKLKAQQKAYTLLEYLNINPRVTYLARLRNPNPKMPDAKRTASQAEPAHS